MIGRGKLLGGVDFSRSAFTQVVVDGNNLKHVAKRLLVAGQVVGWRTFPSKDRCLRFRPTRTERLLLNRCRGESCLA